MNETEWLDCNDPIPMLEFLRDHQRASSRKLRLFSVACCRRIWPFLTEERNRKFVEMAECFADGAATTEDMIRATNESGATGFASDYARAGAKVAIWYAARAVEYAILPRVDPETDNVAWATAAAAALEEMNWSDPRWDRAMRTAYTSGGYEIEDEEHWAEVWNQAAYAMSYNSFTSFPGWHAERKQQAAIVRDIFGNPFRPDAVDPSWLTWSDATLLKIAQGTYEERAFDRLPILADALDEAGCTQADILDHCRSEGLHARGCWVVDLILGKR